MNGCKGEALDPFATVVRYDEREVEVDFETQVVMVPKTGLM